MKYCIYFFGLLLVSSSLLAVDKESVVTPAKPKTPNPKVSTKPNAPKITNDSLASEEISQNNKYKVTSWDDPKNQKKPESQNNSQNQKNPKDQNNLQDQKNSQDSKNTKDPKNLTNNLPSNIDNEGEKEAKARNRSIANTIDKNYSFLYDQSLDTELQKDITMHPRNYVAMYLSNNNIIIIKLLENKNEVSVEKFRSLVKDKFYNNIEFFRLIPDYFIQAGDPSNSGYGGTGTLQKASIDPSLKFERGTVALSNNGTLDSDDSQFFITFNSFDWLNGHYSIIGRVIFGMNALDKLEGSYSNDGFLSYPIRIIKMELLNSQSGQDKNIINSGKIIPTPIRTKGDMALEASHTVEKIDKKINSIKAVDKAKAKNPPIAKKKKKKKNDPFGSIKD